MHGDGHDGAAPGLDTRQNTRPWSARSRWHGFWHGRQCWPCGGGRAVSWAQLAVAAVWLVGVACRSADGRAVLNLLLELSGDG